MSNYDTWKNSVGPGWQPMVHALLRYADERPYLQVDQVKEKFGTLRFYWHGEGEGEERGEERERQLRIFRSMVDGAEGLSSIMCEECGQFGKPTSTGWVLTLCPVHMAQRQKERAR